MFWVDIQILQYLFNCWLYFIKEGETLEVCAKVLFQTEIFRSKKEQDFGFSIDAKSSEDSKQDLSVYISDVGKGIISGSKKGKNFDFQSSKLVQRKGAYCKVSNHSNSNITTTVQQ